MNTMKDIKKITTGFVVQSLDPENHDHTQVFVAGDDVSYENDSGEPIEVTKEIESFNFSFEMINSNQVAIGSIDERGGHAFHSEEGSSVMFSKISDGMYFQAAYTPQNFPAWKCGALAIDDEGLIKHIIENLSGWHCTRCQFKEVVLIDDMVEGDE